MAKLREQNEELREENAELEDEVAQLEEEAEGLLTDVAEARVEAERAEEAAGEAQAAEEESASGDSGGTLTAVGPDQVEGEPLPEVIPDDFPLPSGASVRDVYQDEFSFSMTILLDSTYDETLAFFEEELSPEEWEELVGDRVESTSEGFQGIDTSWERGTYTPLDSPQDDPNYEQTAETLDVGIYELDPSGVQVDVRWYDYELADRQREAEEGGASEGQSS